MFPCLNPKFSHASPTDACRDMPGQERSRDDRRQMHSVLNPLLILADLHLYVGDVRPSVHVSEVRLRVTAKFVFACQPSTCACGTCIL